MDHFLGLYHENCALRYVGIVLKPGKLYSRVFIGQFDVKRQTLEEVAKFGYFRCILTSITHLRPTFMDYTIRIMQNKDMLGGF